MLERVRKWLILYIYIFLCITSPIQWDLLGVRVFSAVGAAAVVLISDVQTVHLSFGCCLFHAVHFKV